MNGLLVILVLPPAALPFIHPAVAMAGAGLAAVPILIHILNRRRFQRVVWAAMDFLLAANRRSARRLRIEQLALMAIARPLLNASTLADALGRTSVHRVIVIDNSCSMAMPSGDGRTAFEHARALAVSLAASFNPSDGVSLITVGAPARTILERPCYDPQVVGEALVDIKPTQRGTDLAGGLTKAVSILEASEVPTANRVVYVITDNTRAAWMQASGVDGGAPTSAKRITELAKLNLMTTGAPMRDNLAVTALTAKTRLIGTIEPASIAARITNYGRERADGVSLRVHSDGRLERTITLPVIEPAEYVDVPVNLRFTSPGMHRVEVVLDDLPNDALHEDNQRRLAVSAQRSVRVLLVDGKPGTSRFDGQTGYLATALAPKAEPTDPVLVAPKTIQDVDLAGEPLDGYAVIALTNVRRVDPVTWRRIDAFVRAGGGLLVFLGDQVSPDHYNRAAYTDGTGLLPAKLGVVVDDQGRTEAYRFDPAEYVHPLLSDFAGAPRGGLLLASVQRYVRVEVPADQPGVRTVLAYDSGDAAIVEKHVGAGRVVLVTTTANMEWTNLPARAGYLPLMQNLLHYVTPSADDRRNVLVGAPLIEPLTARQSSLTPSLTGPNHDLLETELRPAGDGFEIVSTATDQSGMYALRVGRDDVLFAVNIDAAESDLTAMDEDALREQLDCPFEFLDRPENVGEDALASASRDLGLGLFYAVLGLLLFETTLAMWFGRQR
jgi:hypothetical protein